MRRSIKDTGKRLLQALHNAGLRLGLIILPKHYYTPIADIRELKRTKKVWARRSSMIGIELNIGQQASQLEKMVASFEGEFRNNNVFLEGQSKGFGPGFGYIEAQCLHGVLRSLKPKRIVEVGSGVSTYCTINAAALNEKEGFPAKITCIEPYPSEFVSNLKDIKLVTRNVQELTPSEFGCLEPGDFLFIDSTHTVKPGGDVIYLYLEILPRLKPKVVVHIHDIYFPYAYQRDLMHGLFQWSETAILQALLINNKHLRILFSLSMLHYNNTSALKKIFPEYLPAVDVDGLVERGSTGHFPSSTYLVTS